jgi:selenide, water dikinase
VLVDFRTQDDAGVYALDERTALVQTVDFFTPIVDDPYDYGQIAAANALSDVYAMGGTPLTALSIAAFPAADFDPSIAAAIARGGLDLLAAAQVALLGGHTVRDAEVKFGYAITGLVHPREIWTNAGARPGDRLILTKPLGTGIIATAIKKGVAEPSVATTAVASMRALNRTAAQVLRQGGPHEVHACTDVTGFGLLGHAMEMAIGSGVGLLIDVAAVPSLPGALALALDHTPGGGRSNRRHFEGRVSGLDAIPPSEAALLFDPQTSGGLLAAVGAASLEAMLERLRAAGVPAVEVGEVEATSSPGLRLGWG